MFIIQDAMKQKWMLTSNITLLYSVKIRGELILPINATSLRKKKNKIIKLTQSDTNEYEHYCMDKPQGL